MNGLLLAQTTDAAEGTGLGRLLAEFWPVLVPAGLGMAAVYLLLPRARRYPPLWGGLLGGLAVVVAGWWLVHFEVLTAEAVLFYGFAALAVVFAGLMLIQSNPVHAALSFAVVVLSTCGLFLLLAAPFLMAATVIVYAGAIIVTFLFVLMLAQQMGLSGADQRSREPLLASVAGFVLLAAILCVLLRNYDAAGGQGAAGSFGGYVERAHRGATARTLDELREALGDGRDFFRPFQQLLNEDKALKPLRTEAQRETIVYALDAADVAWMTPDRDWALPEEKLAEVKRHLQTAYREGARILSRLHAPGALVHDPELPVSPFGGRAARRDPAGRVKLPVENVAGLGRTLFSDYLLAVEVAGFLLLVATIGAIAIAARRTERLR